MEITLTYHSQSKLKIAVVVQTDDGKLMYDFENWKMADHIQFSGVKIHPRIKAISKKDERFKHDFVARFKKNMGCDCLSDALEDFKTLIPNYQEIKKFSTKGYKKNKKYKEATQEACFVLLNCFSNETGKFKDGFVKYYRKNGNYYTDFYKNIRALCKSLTTDNIKEVLAELTSSGVILKKTGLGLDRRVVNYDKCREVLKDKVFPMPEKIACDIKPQAKKPIKTEVTKNKEVDNIDVMFSLQQKIQELDAEKIKQESHLERINKRVAILKQMQDLYDEFLKS